MNRQVYNLELTEDEVRSIGRSRWLTNHTWQSIGGLTGSVALALITLWLQPDLQENCILCIVGATLAFCFLAIPYWWWNRKMTKAGRRYLKEVTN